MIGMQITVRTTKFTTRAPKLIFILEPSMALAGFGHEDDLADGEHYYEEYALSSHAGAHRNGGQADLDEAQQYSRSNSSGIRQAQQAQNRGNGLAPAR